MPAAGLESTISAGERPQTCALDPTANGNDQIIHMDDWNFEIFSSGRDGAKEVPN
jgi:hypothetical protein